MRRISKHIYPPPKYSPPFATIAFLLAVSISIAPDEGRAQTIACKQLIADMAAQQKMIGAFSTLDYQIREHFLLMANAILSTYGGWNTKEGWASNAAQFRDSTADFENQAAAIKRDIGRNKAVSEEELHRLNSAADSFLGIIAAGEQISRAMEAGRVDDANQIYFETARPIYLQAHGELYTLIKTAERKVSSISVAPCS